jgi:hypothetical protein
MAIFVRYVAVLILWGERKDREKPAISCQIKKKGKKEERKKGKSPLSIVCFGEQVL